MTGMDEGQLRQALEHDEAIKVGQAKPPAPPSSLAELEAAITVQAKTMVLGLLNRAAQLHYEAVRADSYDGAVKLVELATRLRVEAERIDALGDRATAR